MKDILIFAGFFAFLAVFITFAILSEKKRVRRLREACEAAGVRILHGAGLKDEQAAAAFFDRIGLMRDLRTGDKGVRFAGQLRADGQEITLLEHSYTSGSGKNQSTVRHAIAAVEAPAHWPELRITPEGVFRKLAELVGQKDIQLENEEFNRRWRVKTADEDFAIVLLTPQVQARLMEWPKEYRAVIGGGAIAVVASGYITAARLQQMPGLVTGLAALIPSELELWGLDDGIGENAAVDETT